MGALVGASGQDGAVGSLFAVSDVHGYLDDLVEGLTTVGLLDDRRRWVGGDDRLWVLGDLTDRGPDGIGVVDLLRDLQRQAPGQVHVLMGNHEALALGRKRFPYGRFHDSWVLNGGRLRDQEALTDEHFAWLAGLPALAQVDGHLLMHSDTAAYLTWGESVDQVNATVAGLLASGEEEDSWEVFARLTSRYHFTRAGGTDVARGMLATYGGERIVHGHSVIASLTGRSSATVDGPLEYADGLVLAIDGGRYDGGPLLVVRLE